MSHISQAMPSHSGNTEDAAHHLVSPGDIAVGVVIGRASEYFDFFVFGIACVLVFPDRLFPFETPLNGTLYVFAIFALAFVVRPIGTVVSMAIQRRWGRGTKMIVSLFLLGSSTAGIAFLPSYDTLGGTAIALLALLRVGQGLAQGGSWDGLPSLLALTAPPHRRGWYAMIGQLGAPVGFVLASGLVAYLYGSLSLVEFQDWGWRYPFYVAFAINVVALFARLQLIEADEYRELLQSRELEPARTMDLLRNQGQNILIGAFAALASYALFHLVTVFPLSWIKLYAQRDVVSFLLTQVLGGVTCAMGIVASGWIADRVGRRTTLWALGVLIAVFSGFSHLLLGGGEAGQNAFVLLGFGLLGLSYGQSAGTATSNFSPRYRYTGAALTSDLAWLVGAAFAPLVALSLSAYLGLAYVSLYLLSGAACTLAALWINKTVESGRPEV